MKTLSKIVLPSDLSNWYIKKYTNLLQPVRVMVFLSATTVLLITLIFYIKNKKTVDLKLQHQIRRNNLFSRYCLKCLVQKCINVTIFVRYYLSSPSEVFCKKGVPGNFSKFTGKHLWWSVLLIKLQVWGLQLY